MQIHLKKVTALRNWWPSSASSFGMAHPFGKLTVPFGPQHEPAALVGEKGIRRKIDRVGSFDPANHFGDGYRRCPDQVLFVVFGMTTLGSITSEVWPRYSRARLFDLLGSDGVSIFST
jgi:hypothetical protein